MTASTDRREDLFCSHGIPVEDDCEQCEWEESEFDDQSTDDDWQADD